MADFGRNFIDMFGNQAVKDLTTEVNRRLSLCDPETAVGEVFYGLSQENAKEIEKLTGSRWVDHASTSDFGDADQLLFTSDTIPEKLENHLVWFYSKIDPDVVLRNMYDSENGNFVGVRFKIVRGSGIFTFHRHKSIWKTVVSEIDEEDDNDQITWEDLWNIQHDLVKAARAELVAQYPFVEKHVGI